MTQAQFIKRQLSAIRGIFMMLHDTPGFGKLSLQKMMLFHHVVRFGSIAKAARELGVAGHKIHNELNSLEKMLGSLNIGR